MRVRVAGPSARDFLGQLESGCCTSEFNTILFSCLFLKCGSCYLQVKIMH